MIGEVGKEKSVQYIDLYTSIYLFTYAIPDPLLWGSQYKHGVKFNCPQNLELSNHNQRSRVHTLNGETILHVSKTKKSTDEATL